MEGEGGCSEERVKKKGNLLEMGWWGGGGGVEGNLRRNESSSRPGAREQTASEVKLFYHFF